MILERVALSHFRNYTEAVFSFHKNTTFIIGPNTAGKSNLIEAIYFLASGKSFHAEKDSQIIQFGEQIARVKGKCHLFEDDDPTELEVVVAEQTEMLGSSYQKKYLVNGVPKRRVDFAGRLKALLFVPADLDIIVGSPSLRRFFLDAVLEMVDRYYRQAMLAYVRALRQRNALLELVQETGSRPEKQFEYWDHLLITNGQFITKIREEFINFVNEQEKNLLGFQAIYDKSTISEERLAQYKDAEVGTGVTLVGPHRDDFIVQIEDKEKKGFHDARYFGSRGQQRLVVLQLKLLQLSYIKKRGETPLFLMDDIFSELDEKHSKLVLDVAKTQQTIITSTSHSMVNKEATQAMSVIELKNS